jgi:hypothetical protein
MDREGEGDSDYFTLEVREIFLVCIIMTSFPSHLQDIWLGVEEFIQFWVSLYQARQYPSCYFTVNYPNFSINYRSFFY